MVNFMKKIPAGMLLVPMVISALINTLNPEFFHIGGITEARQHAISDWLD
ncbi:2-keto-3-deoxygluconate permease [Aerococcaceae bacterium DSM 111176]|nr:2-keto-3-deoxygluconate permease [Aerococcaceae bacterium DSM 111176]